MDLSKKSGNTHLIFASTDLNKKVFKKCTKLWNGIKKLIKTINDGHAGESNKDFIKTKINLDDSLPLSKILKLCMLQ